MLAEAREEDAERIARLHILSRQATYGADLSPAFLQGQDYAARAADWRHRLAGGVAVLLEEDGGDLAGFVACGLVGGAGPEYDEWEIYNLHVAPSRHGLGLGSRLFDAAVCRGRERGARRLCCGW